jgi:hypothetical protein
MQRLTTTTDDPLPLFVRMADADPRLRYYLFGRQRPGMRIERLSWYWPLLADDSSCAPAKFQRIGAVYVLSTMFPRI